MKLFPHPPFRFALRGIAFTLPLQWEITGYEYDLTKGRFSFSRILEPMGQFSFRKVPAVPDIRRILEEVHRRTPGSSAERLHFDQLESGIIFTRNATAGDRFYASCFHTGKSLLMEWIFAPEARKYMPEIMQMLRSASLTPSEETERNQFALFGIEASIPKEFELEAITPYPANVELVFENKRHHRILVHRYGMASCLLDRDTLKNFYHRILYGRHYAVKTISGTEKLPHIEFKVRGRFGFDALLGPWWKGSGEALLCPKENRIYAVEHIAPEKEEKRESFAEILPGKIWS